MELSVKRSRKSFRVMRDYAYASQPLGRRDSGVRNDLGIQRWEAAFFNARAQLRLVAPGPDDQPGSRSIVLLQQPGTFQCARPFVLSTVELADNLHQGLAMNHAWPEKTRGR